MTQSAVWGDPKTSFFYELTPERVLESVETAGLVCTGRCLALNSFENRVYEVEIESDDPAAAARRRVAKFYRPGRWTRDQILEEHAFLRELGEAEIPAIGPLAFPDGETLRQSAGSGIWYALFPKVGGRTPDELDDERLERVGRLLARIHTVGWARTARHRVRLGVESYGEANLAYLLEGGLIPEEYRGRYERAARGIFEKCAGWFTEAEAARPGFGRLHGDCHPGNLLWNDAGPFFLDFDDMVVGPPVQDLWLLLSSRGTYGWKQLQRLMDAYGAMRDFDRATLRLIEPLRALRFIHFSAWIARRWEDPAFPRAFPQFGTQKYWGQETDDLEGQHRLVARIAFGEPVWEAEAGGGHA